MNANYPEVIFWNSCASKIEIVNPGDFRRNQYLEAIGVANSELVGSFGTSDREEVLRRQKMIRMCVEHKDLREALMGGFYNVTIPTESQSFLDHFFNRSGHSLFWQDLLLIRQTIKKTLDDGVELPNEMIRFYNFLIETQAEEEKAEASFAKLVSDEVTRAVDLSGIIAVEKTGGKKSWSDIGLSEVIVFGFHKYAYHLSDKYRLWRHPSWPESRWAHYLFLDRLVERIIEFHNMIVEKKKYAPLFISHLPKTMEEAVSHFCRSCFNPELDKAVELAEKEVLHFVFYFEYGSRGIVLRLANIEVCGQGSGNEMSPPPRISSDFPGYGWRDRRRIARINAGLADKARRLGRMSQNGLAVLKMVGDKFPDLLLRGHVIEDKTVERDFGWASLGGIIKKDVEANNLYKRIENYRAYVSRHLGTLRNIALIAQAFDEKSKEWKRPLSWPSIEEDDIHLVSFDELWPVHLVQRRKLMGGEDELIVPADIVPIRSLAPLNGQMVVLTGLNASGKTITEEGVVNEIFGAQSGFPSFSLGVRLNVKGTIALAFLERGKDGGSSAQLLGIKTTNALRAAQAAKNNGMVVVLDEAGTGVEQGVGLDLYRRFLQAFVRTGCSTIVATQIPDLANVVKDELGALCFHFDAKRQLLPGIGQSDETHLIKLIGAQDVLS